MTIEVVMVNSIGQMVGSTKDIGLMANNMDQALSSTLTTSLGGDNGTMAKEYNGQIHYDIFVILIIIII